MPLNVDQYKSYRYTQLINSLRMVLNQIRNTARAMDDLSLRFAKASDILADVQALAADEAVLPSPESPTRQELEDALQAVLSYAVYAGAVTADEYTAMMGTPPLTPEEISVKVDSYIG